MEALSAEAVVFSDIVLEIFRLNRLLLDTGDELTEPVGLSSARWQVLGVVEHGPIPAANVARIMGLTRQGVQRTADSLAADGLIAYQRNPHHRRAQLLVLTDKGRTALHYIHQCHAEWANRLSAGHDPQSLQATLAMLRQIRASLDALPPEETQHDTQSS